MPLQGHQLRMGCPFNVNAPELRAPLRRSLVCMGLLAGLILASKAWVQEVARQA